MSCHRARSGKGTVFSVPPTSNFNYILLILITKLIRNSLRNHPEIPTYLTNGYGSGSASGCDVDPVVFFSSMTLKISTKNLFFKDINKKIVLKDINKNFDKKVLLLNTF
jgi:hypothetical protein